MLECSLVIPCYNEAKNLPALVARATEVFEGQGIELILVDNGSSDGTGELLDELLAGVSFARSVRVEVNQGYGFGILEGLRACRGRFIGWTHADMQTDPRDAVTGFQHFSDCEDPELLFVKGHRIGRPMADRIFTLGMGAFETILLQRFMRDINAQPTLFSRSFFESWDAPPHDFALDLYAFYLAKSRGLRVERFPVRFAERLHGVSHWNVDWTSKLRFIRRTIDYSLRLARSRPSS